MRKRISYSIEEVEKLKKEYEELTKIITEMRLKRAKIAKRLRNYNVTPKEKREEYKKSDAYNLLGKRLCELTEEELKEYNKIKQREHRQKIRSK